MVGWLPVEPYASLSNTTWTRLRGRWAPISASEPMFINTLPSPSNTTTRRSGRLSATPSPIDEAKPIDPII